jgi:8-amino-7-oxononanoate synthase
MSDAREEARSLLRSRGGGAAGTVGPAADPVPPPARPGQPAPAVRRRSVSLSDHPEVIAARQRDQVLRAGLDQLGAPDLYYVPHQGVNGAVLRAYDRDLINFCGYNYLGLAGDPRVQAAARQAIDTYGTSCSASRLISGEIPLHAELEARIADAYQVGGAVVGGSGFLTGAAVIAFVLGAKDVAVCDSLVHNSVVSGTRWAGCQRMNFRHNDPESLDSVLRRTRGHFDRAMVILEGVYSMDGDIARLPELAEVARRHDCLIMIDEAHSFGVLGQTGGGIREHLGLPGDTVDIWMGTLSKSLASYGGFIAGPADFVEALRMAAPGLSLFAAGSPPATMAAAIAAFDIMRAEPERLERLQANGAAFLASARQAGYDTGASGGTPIVPVILGDDPAAVIASAGLLKAGINASPILYPAVAQGDARVRFFITSEHTPEQLATALDALREVAHPG